MKKLKIKGNLVSLVSCLSRWRWPILILLTVIAIIDYCDSGFAVGWGLVSRQNKTNLIEVIVAMLLLLTLYETWKSRKEALRQTELTLRPYLRLSWNTTQIGDNRRAQGITDTCVVVSNNGNGLMRQVKYNVEVNGETVAVRNHTLIVSHDSTNMVYDDAKNKAGAALGCRNDESFNKKNNEIIKESKIRIYGSYRDIEGGKYSFSFESDTNEQSWFHEKYRQQLTNKKH